MKLRSFVENTYERMREKAIEAREYIEENPETIRRAMPLAAALLVFLGVGMLMRASHEVPRHAPELTRKHPLQAAAVPAVTSAREHPMAAAPPEAEPAPEPVAEVKPEPRPEPKREYRAATQPIAGPPAPEPASSTRESSSSEAARVALGQFFQSLNDRDYGAAYRGLSTPWRDAVAYQTFATGYSGTDSVDCQVEHVRDFPDGRVRVAVTLDVVEGGCRATYVGTYVMINEGGEWLLDRGLQLRI